jgi:hypothetical protein
MFIDVPCYNGTDVQLARVIFRMASGSSYHSKTVSRRESADTEALIPARASRAWQLEKIQQEERVTEQLSLMRRNSVRLARRELLPFRVPHVPASIRSVRQLTNIAILLVLFIMAFSVTSLARDPQALFNWLGNSQPAILLLQQAGDTSVGKHETLPQSPQQNLPNPDFGPKIENFASYVPQSQCDPTPKPGVIAFRDMLLKAFPSTGSDGITRDCNIGGTSEHKEGRAWDWAVSALDPKGVAIVNQVFTWLFATDKYGHQDAMIRRLGIMYIVWNHHIWSAAIPDQGWLPYNGPNPHTDHVHFSFSWDGAYQRTTFWNPASSF